MVRWDRDGMERAVTHRVLHIYDHGDRQQRAQVDGQVEPVEEAVLVLAVLRAMHKDWNVTS